MGGFAVGRAHRNGELGVGRIGNAGKRAGIPLGQSASGLDGIDEAVAEVAGGGHHDQAAFDRAVHLAADGGLAAAIHLGVG